MSSLFIQTATLRICLGLMFVGLTVAARTAQSEEGSFAPDLDILTIQPERTDADWLIPYRFGASVALTRTPSAAPIESAFGSTSGLSSVAKAQPEAVHEKNLFVQPDRERISLRGLLRVEFKGALFNTTFRPQSVEFKGELLKMTFRPQSASIEGGRLKLTLEPHAASLSWSK